MVVGGEWEPKNQLFFFVVESSWLNNPWWWTTLSVRSTLPCGSKHCCLQNVVNYEVIVLHIPTWQHVCWQSGLLVNVYIVGCYFFDSMLAKSVFHFSNQTQHLQDNVFLVVFGSVLLGCSNKPPIRFVQKLIWSSQALAPRGCKWLQVVACASSCK